MTASHNPGGPNGDFGIKFNCENGGPAPDAVTNKIYTLTTTIKQYKIVPDLQVDIDKVQSTTVDVEGKPFTVDIIDSVNDYVAYMKEIFDFDSIKKLLQGSDGKPPFQVLIDAMNGGKNTTIEKQLSIFNITLLKFTSIFRLQ